jgi:nudix-type nucleoside diphosphatase (YffH/AdpP family)
MILSKKQLYKGWSSLTEYTIKHFISPEKYIPIRREIFNSGDGAAALLYNPFRRVVILIRQFRLAAYINGHENGKMMEVCAGMLDGNDPEDAIINEIFEETGYRIEKVEFVAEVYATPGAHTEKVRLFIAECNDDMLIGEGGGLESEHEDIEVLEIGYEEVLNMVNKKTIQDAKTLILLQHAMIEGIIS